MHMVVIRSGLLLLILLVSVLQRILCVKLGLLVDGNNDAHLIEALNYGIQWSNMKHFMLLPESQQLHKEIRMLKVGNSYEVTDKFCSLVESGVIAIFGGVNRSVSAMLEHLCDQLDIPYFKIIRSHQNFPNTIDLFPGDQILDALIDFIRFTRLKTLVVVYKEEKRLVRLGQLLSDTRLGFIETRFIKVEGENFLEAARTIRRDTKKCSYYTASCTEYKALTLLDLGSVDLFPFLLAALQLGMITYRDWYLITSLDIEYFDMQLFRHNHARISGIGLLSEVPANFNFTEFETKIRATWYNARPFSHYVPMSEAMMIVDAVYTITKGYISASRGRRGAFTKQAAKCGSYSHGRQPTVAMEHGLTLYNYINNLDDKFLTGNLKFSYGKRENMTLSIHQLTYNGHIDKVGTYDARNKDTNISVHVDDSKEANRDLKVDATKAREQPYMMLKKKHEELEGNDKFEGFCVDLLEQLSSDLGFSYQIHLVKDGKYGNVENGTWDGMIGEIMRKEAELAVAPLTVNFRRNQQVDFTKPFLSLGISILYKIPTSHQPSLFSFLFPLSKDTWLYILVSAAVVTVVLFIIGKMSPYEWTPAENNDTREATADEIEPQQQHNHVPNFVPNCTSDPRLIDLPAAKSGDEKSGILKNNFTFTNTAWYVISTILMGGCDFGPQAISTRLLGGIWGAFTLIMISAYTANLAAFLTIDVKFLPIHSLEELANQTEISYGSVKGGSTMQFFRESKNISSHVRIWNYMNVEQERVYVSGNREGVQRVLRENYAFLMESTSLQFEKRRNCNLTQIGGVLGSRGYGIALAKRSQWTDTISREILNYGERGIIEGFRIKWWQHKNGNCEGGASAVKQNEKLSMQNVAGVFVVLVAGSIVSLVIVVLEFLYKTTRDAKKKRRSVYKEMSEDLRMAVHHNSTRKRRAARSSSSHAATDCSECDRSVSSNLVEMTATRHRNSQPGVHAKIHYATPTSYGLAAPEGPCMEIDV